MPEVSRTLRTTAASRQLKMVVQKHSAQSAAGGRPGLRVSLVDPEGCVVKLRWELSRLFEKVALFVFAPEWG